MPELVVRPYKTGDEDKILHLHDQVFSQGRTLEQWRWQCCDNPAGKAIIYVISADQAIVGHFSIIPLAGWYNNKSIVTGKAEGGMVKKEARFLIARKRLFKKIIQEASAEAFRQGVSIVWGLTNSPRDFIKGGFQHLGTIKALQKDLSYKCIIKNTIFACRNGQYDKIPPIFTSIPHILRRTEKYHQPPGTVEVVTQKILDRNLDRLWQTSCNNAKFSLVKSNSFIEWRFLKNPFCPSRIFVAVQNGSPLGYMICSSVADNGIRRGYILDYCVDPEYLDFTLSLLWKEAKRFFQGMEVDYVSCWSLDNSEHASFNTLFEQYGFCRKVDVMDVIAILNPESGDPGLLDLKNWFVSMAFGEGRFG